MTIDAAQIEAVIRKVLATVPTSDEPAGVEGDGVFADMGAAIEAAAAAAAAYRRSSMTERRRYVAAIREVMLKPENLDHMSAQAVIETGMGDVAHKYLKNKFAAENTPGVEDLETSAWSGDDGLTTVEYWPTE